MKNQIIIAIMFLTSLSLYSQGYTFVGPQISVGIVTNSFDKKIKPSIEVGIEADWLVRGDFGGLRLGLGYHGFSSSTTENNEVRETFVSQINIPLSYRWTFIRGSRFNLLLGNGIMIPTKKDVKLSYYLTCGIEAVICLRPIGCKFLLGLHLKHSINNTSINNAYDIKPFLAQLSLGYRFQTSPRLNKR